MATEKPKLEKKILVYYHGGCLDGFSSAWVTHKNFGDEAEYIPISHQDRDVFDVKNKTIFFVDILPAEEILKELLKNNEVTTIDHHITNKENIKLVSNHSFDLQKSGAVLTWEYFNPGQDAPLFLKHVQAQDIWVWTLPFTREIMATAGLYEQTFGNWDKIATDIENEQEKNKYIEKGKVLLEYYNKICDLLIEDLATEADFENHRIWVANVPHMFASIVGHKLADKTSSFSVTWCQEEDAIHISLRSVKDFDITEIAKKHGGGGHKNAGGFEIKDFSQIPWKIVKKKL